MSSNKTVTKIYEDYSQFISFTNSEYQKQVSDLLQINFTQQDVLDDARLSQDKIKHFEELETVNERNNQTSAQANERITNEDQQQQEKVVSPNSQQHSNSNPRYNPFFNGVPQNLPIPPTADVRFYPYTKKQK
jgi:hypothetical protein